MTAPVVPNLGPVWVFVIFGMVAFTSAWVESTPASLPDRFRTVWVTASALLLVFGTAGSAVYFAHGKSLSADDEVQVFIERRCGPATAAEFERRVKRAETPLATYRDLRAIAGASIGTTCATGRAWDVSTLTMALEIWCDDDTVNAFRAEGLRETPRGAVTAAIEAVRTGTCAGPVPLLTTRRSQ